MPRERRRYLLNAPVLPNDGRYELTPLSHAMLNAWRADPRLISAVGHVGAADWMARALGRGVVLSRERVFMAPGDEALVVCLAARPLVAAELSMADMDGIGCELRHLRRLG